jgi:Phosphatidylinositol-4-phosphate 5-Kinase
MDVSIKPEIRKLLVAQLKQDAMFFQKGNINDYSLLLGICDLEPGEA